MAGSKKMQILFVAASQKLHLIYLLIKKAFCITTKCRLKNLKENRVLSFIEQSFENMYSHFDAKGLLYYFARNNKIENNAGYHV